MTDSELRLEPDCVGVEGASSRAAAAAAADPAGEESGRESRLPPAADSAAVGP